MTAVTKIEDQPENLPVDPMISMIERVVMNPSADLDKLERMLAMKERMDAQNAKVAFARALSAARTNIPPIIKDAEVDYHNKDGKRTNYKHETLAGIAKVIDPILAEHGLSYRFRTDQGNGGVRVTCIIQHNDGHSEETSLSGAPDGSGSKNSFQAVGSAVTYLQRYTLKAALGLSAEVDDDGSKAAPRADAPQPQQQQRPRDPWTHTIVSELPEEATPLEKATAIADALCAQFKRMKGVRQLSNEWDRRVHLIEGEKGFEAKYPKLHERVVDAYENRRNEITEEGARD